MILDLRLIVPKKFLSEMLLLFDKIPQNHRRKPLLLRENLLLSREVLRSRFLKT